MKMVMEKNTRKTLEVRLKSARWAVIAAVALLGIAGINYLTTAKLLRALGFQDKELGWVYSIEKRAFALLDKSGTLISDFLKQKSNDNFDRTNF